jgi:hypothetical protein
VQVLLGHASIATTARYTAVDDDAIRAAMVAAQAWACEHPGRQLLRSAVARLTPVTDFGYRPEEGSRSSGGCALSGYDDETDDEWDWGFRHLSELEYVIEQDEAGYGKETGTSLLRVHGSHGWRVSSGTTARSIGTSGSTRSETCDRCKSPDAAVYMVNDELWASSGLDGWACYRCLEEAIGRRLGGLRTSSPDRHWS